MQSFLERLLKYIAKEEKILSIDERFTLGKLLDQPSLEKFLKYKLFFEEYDLLLRINELSNEYKHGNTFVIRENELLTLFSAVTELIDAFVSFKGKKSGFEKPITKYFETLLTRFDMDRIRSANEEIILEKNKEFEALASQKEALNDQLQLLRENQQRMLSAKQLKEKLIQKITDQKNEVVKIQNESKTLESELKNISKKTKDGIVTEEEKKRGSVIYDLLSVNDRKISDLEEDIFNGQLNVNKDQQSIEQTRYESLIQEQEEKIRELNNIIEENKQKINDIASNKFKPSFEERSQHVEKLRNLYSRVKLNSNYKVLKPFEITNLTLNSSSESKYASFYAVIFNLLVRSEVIPVPEEFKAISEDELSNIYQLQILILGLLKENVLDDSKWVIKFNVNEDELIGKKDQFILASKNIFANIQKLCTLSKIKFIEPEIVFDDIQENTIFINFENEISKKNNFSILVDSVFGDDSLPSLWIEDRIPYRIDNQSNEHVEILTYFLKTIFNFNQFREGQINIIANFLNGRNTIGVLPTGAGKSLTYYISVILQPKIALVIAPILALMKDQVQKLEQNFKLNYVTTISSMNDNESNKERLLLFKNARVMFTLVSPERLQSEKFRDALVKLSNEESIGAVVLDEVHCLSEWGHDFRPSYLMLSTTLNAFAPNAKFLGLTATASINVVKDIMIELRIRSSSDVKFVSKLKRKNLSFKITKVPNEEAIAKHINELLIKSNRNGESLLNVTPKGINSNCGIIFCTTKSDRKPTGTGSLYNELEPYIGPSLGRFDGDYKEDQDPFMSNEKTLLIATKAFGMGIDKPNIRFTIHAGMPSSREAFYQEAGRAGRDNKDANCILISGNDDDGTNKRSLIQEFLNIKTPVSRLKEISKSTKNELGYVDISTHFYFMSNEINEPEQEANRLFELYKEIYDYVNLSKNYVFTRKVNPDDSKNFEQYFVQLHKLGIINNYTVRYGFMVEFKIDIHHLHHQFDHLKEKAIEYLKTYDANSDIVNVLERYSSLNDVPKLLFLLRRWYHDTFIRTKREQLANVHTFINRHIDSDSDKIQEEIEQFFDLSSYFKDEKKTSEFSETDSYGEIVDKVFNVVEEDISKKIIATEFLIESIVNTRIDVYISLLHLRDGKSFIQENNGRQRFEYALSNLGVEDRNVLKEKVINYYERLSLNSRIWIIESFEKEGMPILGDIFNRYPSDEISYKMSLSIRNQTLNSIMKGEK